MAIKWNEDVMTIDDPDGVEATAVQPDPSNEVMYIGESACVCQRDALALGEALVRWAITGRWGKPS